MNTPLSPKGLGIAFALLSALTMLILSIVGLVGYGQEALSLTQAYFVGYNLTFLGITIGIVEAIVGGYISGWLIAVFYNKFA